MSIVSPRSTDFEGAVYENYRKCIRKRQWSIRLTFDARSGLPSWKQDLALAVAAQGCHAEHLGMCTAAKLLLEAPTSQLRYAFAAAAQDEASHSDVLGQYVLSRGYDLAEPNANHVSMVSPLLSDDLSYEERAALHCFLEGFALDQFKTFAVAFDGDLLGDIYANIRQDEARHVALGMTALRQSFAMKQSPQFDLERVDGVARKLGGLGEHLFEWLSLIEEVPTAAIRRRYERNHTARVHEIHSLTNGESK